MKRSETVLRVFIAVLFVLILFAVPALGDNLYTYESLILEENISNGLEIIPSSTAYDVSYVDISLKLIPLSSERQEILSESISPEPEKQDEETVLFHWKNPSAKIFSFKTSSKVKTSGNVVKVTKPVPFPLTDVPLEFQKYLETTDYIDINPEIKNTAFTLATNVNDLFELEFKFAEWVNKEITYNLSTLTSETNEPSSWVYENRYGVCDEITNLFISFNRAVGVPARFISGIAYSELVENNWGNHGWAEVYFPEIGWIPFDVTYEEYGFVDATHIALAKQVDGGSPSVKYATRGHDYEFDTLPMNFTTEIIAKGKKLSEKTETVLGVQENVVGFGSYNLIIAEIKNPWNFYVSEEVSLSQTEGLDILDDMQQRVLLKPKESKKIYWLVKIKKDLNSNYVYTFPVSATLSQGTIIKNSFKVQQSGEKYSQLYMKQFLTNQEEKELFIDCQATKTALLNQQIQVSCGFTKNEFPITLCLKNNCKTLESKDDIISLPLESTQIGTHTVIIKSQNGKYQTFVTYKVSDIASLDILNASMPKEIDFDEQGRLEILVKKKSLANPENVSIQVTNGFVSENWNFVEFSEDKAFDVLIDGDTLALGKNTFIIAVEYTDNLGKRHTTQKVVQTTMNAKNIKQKVSGLLNRFSIEVNKLGSKLSKDLFGQEKPQLQQFFVMVITFLILIIVIGIIRTILRSIKRKMINRLN